MFKFQFLFRFLDLARHQRRKRILNADQAAGRRGEDLAHRYLQKRGFTVIARNYRARSGIAELDIVAKDGETLVFVEVKARSSDKYGPPDRAVGEEKRRRLFRGAREYVRRAGADWEHVRFDLVSVVLSEPPHCTHLRDVFPLATAP